MRLMCSVTHQNWNTAVYFYSGRTYVAYTINNEADSLNKEVICAVFWDRYGIILVLFVP